LSKNDRWNADPSAPTNNPWDKMKTDAGFRPRARMGHFSGKMDMTYLIVLLVMVAVVIAAAALRG